MCKICWGFFHFFKIIFLIFFIFPECGARVPVSLWGLSVCSLDVAQPFATVRNRPQPSATVRNRPQPFARGRYGRAYGKFCSRGHFWRFHMLRSLVSRGRHGTSWHSDVFVTCRKSFCVASAILLRRFQKMNSSFRGRRSTLDVTVFILCGRRSTLEESCCVFLRIAFAGLPQVVATCKFHGRRCILWDVLKIDGSLARNIGFEVANFEVHKKTRRKTSILKLQSVKIGGSLARNLVLMLQHVSSWVSGFPVASPCLWGKLQNLSCFKVSKPVVTRFCVTGAAVRDIFTCLRTCRKSFCVASAIPLRTLHSTLYTPHFTCYTPHCALHTLHSSLYTLHSTLRTPHSTLYTPHSTLHFKLHTPLYTPHFTLPIPHFTLHTLRFTLQTLHITIYTPHFTLYNRNSHSTLYTPHSTLYSLHLTLYTPHYSAHSPLYTPYFTLYTRHSALYTPRTAL